MIAAVALGFLAAAPAPGLLLLTRRTAIEPSQGTKLIGQISAELARRGVPLAEGPHVELLACEGKNACAAKHLRASGATWGVSVSMARLDRYVAIGLAAVDASGTALTESSFVISATDRAELVRNVTAFADAALPKLPTPAPQKKPEKNPEVRNDGEAPAPEPSLPAPAEARFALPPGCTASGADGLGPFTRPSMAAEAVTACAHFGGFAANDFVLDGSRDVFVYGAVSARYQLTAPVSIHLNVRYAYNTNTLSRPLTTGVDTLFGLTAGASLFGFALSGTAALDLPAGVSGVAPEAFGAQLQASVARPVWGPLSAHAAAAFHLNNRKNLARGLASDLAAFALGVEQYHRLGVKLGISATWARLEPFAAWQLDVPLGAGGAPPQRLTLGARVALVDRLAADVSLDIGLAGRPEVGVAPTAPWLLAVSLAWASR